MNRPTLLIFALRGVVLESLCGFLEIANHAQILATVNTLPALQQALSHCRPDLVIVDAYNPDNEGVEVARQIKTSWPGVRCLVLAESRAQLEAAQAGGADEALLWGFSTERLAARVREMTAPADALGELAANDK
jgi:DNA-binding NarL/FixJ family response regulator